MPLSRLLRRLIKSHLDTMTTLHDQLSRVRQPTGLRSSSVIGLAQQDALLDLGWSMYRHGVVPDSPSTSPSTSEQSLEPHSPSPNRLHRPIARHKSETGIMPPPRSPSSSRRRNSLTPARPLPPPPVVGSGKPPPQTIEAQ
jgi:hypothetical protein